MADSLFLRPGAFGPTIVGQRAPGHRARRGNAGVPLTTVQASTLRSLLARPMARRLLVASPFVAVAVALVALAIFFMDVLSAARAYVGGESLWTKGQKQAVQQLERYARTGAEASWQGYRQAIAVPLGDRVAREELEKPAPDYEVARRGFAAGGNHADDIDGMIRLFRWFRRVSFIDAAIRIWTEADGLIAELNATADELRRAVQAGAPPAALAPLLQRIETLDVRLTPLEVRFSATLGEATRKTLELLTTLMVGMAVLLTVLGGLVARSVAARGSSIEARLRASEERFRSLWETTNDAILIVSVDHKIRFANPAVRKLFGYGAEELVGRSLSMLQPEGAYAAHKAALQRYLDTHERTLDWNGTETRARHRDGSTFPVEIVFSEMRLEGERLFVGFLRDITRRKEAERSVREANDRLEQRVAERTRELREANDRLLELDRMKSQFLATMSHELRTPLNSILGFASLMREGLSGPLTPEQQRQLGFVHGSGEHLLALINDLLDLSRIESGRMDVALAPFDFAAVAAEVGQNLKPLIEQKGLALEIHVPHSLPMVGDRRKCYQVLLNLTNNAVKFTERGAVRIDASAEDGKLSARVSDTGIGIRPEQLRLLFEAFRQLDGSPRKLYEGTGLGLHLCRKLLDLMDGEIRVESEYRTGSCFSFTVPLDLGTVRRSAAH
jgi:PAS domain S-box-containing protein